MRVYERLESNALKVSVPSLVDAPQQRVPFHYGVLVGHKDQIVSPSDVLIVSSYSLVEDFITDLQPNKKPSIILSINVDDSSQAPRVEVSYV